MTENPPPGDDAGQVPPIPGIPYGPSPDAPHDDPSDYRVGSPYAAQPGQQPGYQSGYQAGSQQGAQQGAQPGSQQGPQQGAYQSGSRAGAQPGPGGTGPRVSGEQIRDLGLLRRSTYDRHVGGVAGGIGRHLDIDPIIVRVAFVVLTFFGGAGLIIYLACWLIVPDETGQRATLPLDPRSRTVVLVVVGVLAGLALISNVVGERWGPGWFPWPLFAIGLIAWILLTRKDRRADAARSFVPYDEGGLPPYGADPTMYGASAPGTQGAAPDQGSEPWTGAMDSSRATATYPYAATAYPQGGPPPTAPMPPWVRNPRKRGPILFGFTVALIALAGGVLGIVDLAGASVPSSAYPALGLGVVAMMLLVGAFYGRAGGLIALGLVMALALGVGTIADRWDSETIRATPLSASELDTSYYVEAGAIELDLTQIRDLDQLDGRTLDLSADVGTINVIVPAGLHVSSSSKVDIGSISVFDRRSDGLDIRITAVNRGDARRPHLRIDSAVDLGDVTVNVQ